jgi:hypothetical protein
MDNDEDLTETAYYVCESGTTGRRFFDIAIKRSVARCARVSYLNHEGKKSTIEEDLQLYNRLLGGVPIHASPAEHQAQALARWDEGINRPTAFQRSGNLQGWYQYRKTLENENVTSFKK